MSDNTYKPYIILRNDDGNDMEKIVARMMEDGYVCQGGISTNSDISSSFRYVQAMIFVPKPKQEL